MDIRLGLLPQPDVYIHPEWPFAATVGRAGFDSLEDPDQEQDDQDDQDRSAADIHRWLTSLIFLPHEPRQHVSA
jgi:hypothetical protein